MSIYTHFLSYHNDIYIFAKSLLIDLTHAAMINK